MPRSITPSHLPLVLILVLVIASCAGRSPARPLAAPPPTDAPPVPVAPVEEPSGIPDDFDPYFRGTDWSAAPFGPRVITRNIDRDRHGSLWLSTWDGIVRFDGDEFVNFTNRDGLRRFRSFDAFEDRDGILWFGTIGAGVYRYDGTDFTNITARDGLPDDRVGFVGDDSAGNLWFGANGGASRFDGATFQNFLVELGFPDNDVNWITEDAQGRMWVGTRGEARIIEGDTVTRVLREDGTPFINVRCILRDAHDQIWLGGNDGLWRYDGRTFTRHHEDFVGFMTTDRAGSIWLGAVPQGSHGFSLYRSTDDRTAPSVGFEAVYRDRGQIFGILEAEDGAILFGTERGAYRYDGETVHRIEE